MVVVKKSQVDSGASGNVIPAKLFSYKPLESTTKTLQMWSDITLQPLGSCYTVLQNLKNRKKLLVEFSVVGKQLTLIILNEQLSK